MDKAEIIAAVRSSQRRMRRIELAIGVVAIVFGAGVAAMHGLIIAEQADKEAATQDSARANPALDFVDELRAKSGKAPAKRTPQKSAAMKKAEGTAEMVWWVGIIMASIGLALVLQKTFLRKPNIADKLDKSPESIIWLYKKISTGRVSGIQVARFEMVVFGLDTKKRVEVGLKPPVVQALLEKAGEFAPKAVQGYSKEAEKQFKARG